MQRTAAFLFRNLLAQRARRVAPVVVLVLAAFLVPAFPALAADGSLVNNSLPITGGIEVVLVYTDTDGKQQEFSLTSAPSTIFGQLPQRLQLESKLPFLQPGFFLADWSRVDGSVCQDMVGQIKQDINSPDNSAYNVSCKPMKYGLMHAQIQTEWEDNILQGQVKGRRLVIWYYVPPFSSVPFYVTSPATCHKGQGNMFCADDPKYTMLYDVNMVWIITGPDRKSIKLPLNVVASGDVTMQALLNGAGYDKQIQAAISKWESQMAVDGATAIADWYAALITAVVQTVKDLLFNSGALYADVANQHLRDEVSARINNLASGALGQGVNTGADALNNFIVALESATALGFTDLDVDVGPRNSLQFKLTYPAPAKPQLQNTIVTRNKGIHLSPPSIATGVQEIKPGIPFLVEGNNFLVPYTNDLQLSWNTTVVGVPKTTVQWGPKGGQMQETDVASAPGSSAGREGGSFAAEDLKPETTYQFRIHQCDSISCAPWSDWLTASTQKGGSNEVAVRLDNDSSRPIGTGVINPNGSFAVQVLLPAGTAPGTHTLLAAPGASSGTETMVGRRTLRTSYDGNSSSASQATAAGEKSDASVQITVCGSSGCGPSISVLDSQTKTAINPPINLLYPSTFMLRGDHFAPATIVTLHLDSPTGTKLGTAVPNKLGTFEAGFQLPMVQTGRHKLVAVQAAGGRSLQATEEVLLASQPK